MYPDRSDCHPLIPRSRESTSHYFFPFPLSKYIEAKLRIWRGSRNLFLSDMYQCLARVQSNLCNCYRPILYTKASSSRNIRMYTYYSVTLDRGTNLFRAWCDIERRFRFQSIIDGLLSDISATTHVLVRAVRAGTDQADLDLVRPAILLGSFTWFELVQTIWALAFSSNSLPLSLGIKINPRVKYTYQEIFTNLPITWSYFITKRLIDITRGLKEITGWNNSITHPT